MYQLQRHRLPSIFLSFLFDLKEWDVGRRMMIGWGSKSMHPGPRTYMRFELDKASGGVSRDIAVKPSFMDELRR